jgi:hypothetical protein
VTREQLSKFQRPLTGRGETHENCDEVGQAISDPMVEPFEGNALSSSRTPDAEPQPKDEEAVGKNLMPVEPSL